MPHTHTANVGHKLSADQGQKIRKAMTPRPPTHFDAALLMEAASIRMDLNGLRLVQRLDPGPGDDPTVYLIMDGLRRGITDPVTYDNLFEDWSGIQEYFDLPSIQLGPPLSAGAIVVRGSDTAPVYLVSNGVKRYVTSPAAMKRFHFKWPSMEAGTIVPTILLDSIADGLQIVA